MAALGCDYSWGRPPVASLKAAGVSAVGRYLATDGRGITAAEYQDLRNQGLGVWVVIEHQSTDLSTSILQGRAKGIADAQEALSQVKAVGLPPGIPIFWAADFDIGPGSSRVAQADAYVDGFNTVIPRGRRGGYGGLWYLKHVHDAGKVDALWECASTSFRHGVDPGSVPLHLQQTTKTPPVPGTDHNYIFSMPAGGGATPISNGDGELIDVFLRKIPNPKAAGGFDQAYYGLNDYGYWQINPQGDITQLLKFLPQYGGDPKNIPTITSGEIDALTRQTNASQAQLGASVAPTAAQNAAAVEAILADNFAAVNAAIKAVPVSSGSAPDLSGVTAAIAALSAKVGSLTLKAS